MTLSRKSAAVLNKTVCWNVEKMYGMCCLNLEVFTASNVIPP